jgi:atypical dual specificity phosphatase
MFKEEEYDKNLVKISHKNVLINRIVLIVCFLSSILIAYVTNNRFGNYVPIMVIAIIEWYRSYTRETRSYYGLCRLLIYILLISLWIVFVLKLIIELIFLLIGYRDIKIGKIENLFPYALMFMTFARSKQDMDLNDKRRYIIHLLYDIPAFLIVILLKLLNNPLNSLYSQITEYAYIGCFPTSGDVIQLNNIGIKYVVNMCAEYKGPLKTYSKYGIEQLYLPTIDSTAPSLKSIEKAIEFLHQAYIKKEKMFIHCKCGMARSATILFCHLVANEHFSPEDAIKLIKQKRPEVTTTITDYTNVQTFLFSLKKINFNKNE